MSRNGSGIYNLPTGNPVVTGTTITSNWANTTLSDIATALTGSVAADGQTPMTGDLQMNSFKVTGMATPSASTDASTKGYVDSAISTATSALGTMSTQNANAVAITGGTVTNASTVYVGQTSAPYGGVLAAKASYGNVVCAELNVAGPGTCYIAQGNATATNYDFFGAYKNGSGTRIFGVGYDGVVGANYYNTNSGASISSNGYTRLVNGLILQWGYNTANANAQTVLTFPITFPNNIYSFSPAMSINTVGVGIQPIGWASSTQSAITITNGNAYNLGYFWIAIGN
jgi:hypothetical protein